MSEQAPPEASTRNNSSILRDIVQTFSYEAQIAARRKADELGYSLSRGAIPFEETLVNLSRNRDILLASINTGALPQLPLKIQKTLISDATNVATNLTAMVNGADSLVPLETAVDDLTATVWTSNLQNMSGEVLGLQEKLNQLKNLEVALRELAKRAEHFKDTEKKANH